MTNSNGIMTKNGKTHYVFTKKGFKKNSTWQEEYLNALLNYTHDRNYFKSKGTEIIPSNFEREKQQSSSSGVSDSDLYERNILRYLRRASGFAKREKMSLVRENG